MKDIISGLNKVFDSRVRLGIMSALMVNDSVDFNTMRKLLDVTDGNLASHLKALKKRGCHRSEKTVSGAKTKHILHRYSFGARVI